MCISPKSFLALVLIVIGLVVPLFSHAAEEDPVTNECASNQPQLRKLFKDEMDQLKKFEGLWTDISTKNEGSNAFKQDPKTPWKQPAFTNSFKAFLFNANKEEIQMQLSSTDGELVQKTQKPQKVTVCRTKKGVMRIQGAGVSIDMMVLNGRSLRMKMGDAWYPFYRNDDVHHNFLPVTANAGTVDTQKPAEKPAEKPVDKSVAKPVEKPATMPFTSVESKRDGEHPPAKITDPAVKTPEHEARPVRVIPMGPSTGVE